MSDTYEYNPISVEKEILTTVNEISQGVIAAREAHKQKLKTEREYKRAYARAFMAHKGPQTEKKVAANIVPEVMDAEDQRDAWAVAYEYAKDNNRALSAKLDAIRSVGASVRQAYANAGRGEW
ncbi:hypothetical protein JOEDIRT_63 [Mycobacterium phage JoeDirt]|uniref:Uncharacterized protein n=4 Tax=Bronvirus TaxID=1623278 RepID=A0A411BPC8_9CAUD|nr:hypothetical protein FGG55_gp063 [Mycobacterium phage JoeDirt]YP_010100959.1 hypothetical protein KNU44_gp063 [Mycobacterium phage CicholasNage]YP_010101369.1 hypothetical protein KNU48_gp096 [Mycobacterium phage Silverleaf]AEZ50741.1 hypothetical protein [Mycobacterium phage Fezzik]AZS12218.1 hypothetical protein SEA_ACQUIRE49_64 [Mycobacterium phage Acquire49]QDK04068.1 hypothetical protein SEA_AVADAKEDAVRA_64 [Mycobacterium phage AvadaKedavra]QGJ92469.1 hypothetical protein SEA_WYATT2_6